MSNKKKIHYNIDNLDNKGCLYNLAFGSRSDLRDTFGAMAYEFLKQGLLSYEDMLLQLQAAVLLNTPYKPR